ncbi:MAG: hypothetical protein MTP17_02195 [Candidatus Midichloria sp.]|nr:MAG: hypothetical protein MTP17_02195 [Candidatus Midichloria sp.]
MKKISINIAIPQLEESVTEVTVTKWRKKPGGAVKVDEILLEPKTDKVTLEVTAPSAGVISKISAADGATVKANQVLGVINKKAVANHTRNACNRTKSSPNPTANAENTAKTEKSPAASPAATKIATDSGVSLFSVSGTERWEGSPPKGDVIQAISLSSALLSTPTASSSVDNRAPAKIWLRNFDI